MLQRKQFILDVLHPSRPNVSKAELSEKLASIYKADKNRVVTFGFRTHFGGGRSTGFALIYDDEAAQKKFEPKHRLVRVRGIPAPVSFGDILVLTVRIIILSLVLPPRWTRHPENCARSARTVARRFASIHSAIDDLSAYLFVAGTGYEEGQGRRTTQEEVDVASSFTRMELSCLVSTNRPLHHAFLHLSLSLPSYVDVFGRSQCVIGMTASVVDLQRFVWCYDLLFHSPMPPSLSYAQNTNSANSMVH